MIEQRLKILDTYLGDRTRFEGYLALVRDDLVEIVTVRTDRLVDVVDIVTEELLQGYAPSAVRVISVVDSATGEVLQGRAPTEVDVSDNDGDLQ